MMAKIAMMTAMMGIRIQAAEWHTFKPGALWPDSNGVHINAHGGGILFHEGIYYWFGEHTGAGKKGKRGPLSRCSICGVRTMRWMDAISGCR